MSRYNDDASAGNAPAADAYRCHANGCPLPGAISESTKGGGPWFCRFHFGRQADLWPQITDTVRGTMRENGPDSRAPAHFEEPAQ